MLAPSLDGEEFFAEPGPTLDRLRSESPVFFHEPWNAWVLTRYADVASVVRDPRFSVDRGGSIGRSPHPEVQAALDECNRFFGSWMVFSDAPRHGRLRDRVASAFTPARVRKLSEQIDAILLERIDALRAQPGELDLLASVADPLPARITSRLLGLPEGAEADLHRFTDDFFALFGASAADPEIVLAAHRSLAACRGFFEQVLLERRLADTDDVLSAIVRAEAEHPTLEPDELLGVAMTLVAGAYGTTTHLIAHATLALLESGWWSRLASDPSLCAGAVEETLRYDGPAFAVVRRATQDVDVGGRRIRANDRVYLILHAANHDPAAFPDPARFDPTRSPNRHLGLGAGVHFCLGASLTRLEATSTLAALTRAFPDLELAAPAVRQGNLSMRGLSRLRVRRAEAAAALPRHP